MRPSRPGQNSLDAKSGDRFEVQHRSVRMRSLFDTASTPKMVEAIENRASTIVWWSRPQAGKGFDSEYSN